MTTDSTRKPHHGKNIKRYRNMRQVKQEALATALGGDWTQKKISTLETQEEIEEALLDKIARILNIELETLKEFNDESQVGSIHQYNYDGSPGQVNSAPYGTFVQNAYEDFRESVKENKDLYKQLLKEKDEKIELLQQMLALKDEVIAVLKGKGLAQ